MPALSGVDRTARDFLCVALHSFGEDELVEEAKGISKSELDRVNARCEELMWSGVHPPNRDGGLRLATSLALAGVEILEGKPRALRRTRRRPYRSGALKLPDDGSE
jgi:hypothetical protein